MRIVYMSDELERQAFADQAAKNFAEHPEYATFGDVEPDTWFAVRWGMHKRAVLVFKISDTQPVVYGDLIPQGDEQP